MKEKRDAFAKGKKGDEHPFTPYLFEDEKILWMDGAKNSFTTAPANERQMFAMIWVAALVLWFLAVNQYGGVSVALSTSCACAFLIGMVYALAAFWPMPSKTTHVTNPGIYAVTDRHLFYWDGQQVRERTLEGIPHVHLEPGTGSQGTLTFGNVFPSWPNIDDAAYVKTMIEQARKHRLEEDL